MVSGEGFVCFTTRRRLSPRPLDGDNDKATAAERPVKEVVGTASTFFYCMPFIGATRPLPVPVLLPPSSLNQLHSGEYVRMTTFTHRGGSPAVEHSRSRRTYPKSDFSNCSNWSKTWSIG